MTLAEQQRAFWELVTRRERGEGASQRGIAETDALTAADRVAIYAGMFTWRQIDSLREDFPKLAAAHSDFDALAEAYLARHPSRHHSLAQLGRSLPTFLASHPTDRSDLADLAALEWARADVFEEADARVLTQPDDLGRPLPIIPALRIVDMAHDAVALWQAVDEGRPLPEPARTPTCAVVWRKAYDVFHVRLDTAEACAFKQAAQGADMESVCEAFEHASDPIAAALRAVGSWFAEGWICALDTDSGH